MRRDLVGPSRVVGYPDNGNGKPRYRKLVQLSGDSRARYSHNDYHQPPAPEPAIANGAGVFISWRGGLFGRCGGDSCEIQSDN